MKKERIGSLCALWCVGTLMALQAVVLRGRVTDAGDGTTLPGVSIRVVEQGRGTSSDSEGDYSLELSPGSWQIEFSMLGFEKRTERVRVRENMRLDVALVESASQLQEVVVDGRKREELLRMETGVQRLTVQSIRQMPALFGEVDVIKAIQMLPGVQPAAEGTSSYSVRGGSPSQNLIQLDEATVFNANHLMGFFSVFNNDVVRDITLYKGDMPAAGGGRLSSLLDIKTKEEVKDRITLDGGVSLIASRLMVGASTKDEKLSVYVAGRRSYADAFLALSPEEGLRNSTLYFYDLNGGASWRINNKHRLSFSIYNGEDRFGADMGQMQFGNTTASLRWNMIFTDKLYAQMSLSGSRYGYFFGTNAVGFDADWRSSVQSAAYKYGFTWEPNEKHRVQFGVQSNFYVFDPARGLLRQPGQDPIRAIVPQKQAWDISGYIEEHFRVNSRLSLRAGLRYTSFFNVGASKEYLYDDQFELKDSVRYGRGSIYNHYFAFEPRFGATYRLGADNIAKASVTHNQQFVHLISTTFSGSPFDFWMPSTPNIRPTSSWQYAVGYQHNLFSDAWEFSAEAYYKQLDRVLDYKDHPSILLNEQIDGELREGVGYGYGLELMARRSKGPITGWVSYTFSRAFQQVGGVNNDRWYSSPSDRPHNVNVVANWQINDRWSVSGNWVFVTGQPTTFPEGRIVIGGESYPVYGPRNSYRMDDYHRLDLGGTYKLNRPSKKRRWNHELSISIYNVYNRYNVWYINFTEDPKGSGVIYADKLYLFPIIPSIAYNFKF